MLPPLAVGVDQQCNFYSRVSSSSSHETGWLNNPWHPSQVERLASLPSLLTGNKCGPSSWAPLGSCLAKVWLSLVISGASLGPPGYGPRSCPHPCRQHVEGRHFPHLYLWRGAWCVLGALVMRLHCFWVTRVTWLRSSGSDCSCFPCWLGEGGQAAPESRPPRGEVGHPTWLPLEQRYEPAWALKPLTRTKQC